MSNGAQQVLAVTHEPVRAAAITGVPLPQAHEDERVAGLTIEMTTVRIPGGRDAMGEADRVGIDPGKEAALPHDRPVWLGVTGGS